jgi:cyclopropane-fatty-acyl-phospholipid synthase
MSSYSSSSIVDASAADGAHLRAARRVAAELFGPPAERAFAIRYWDGTTDRPAGDVPFTLVINDASAFRRMLLPPSELTIAESYLFGDVDVYGDIEAAAMLGDLLRERIRSIGGVVALVRHLLELPSGSDREESPAATAHVARRLRRFGRMHSPRRDAQAVRFHYDVGNEFYSLWLDRQLVYSCGYFPCGTETLDDAQSAKLDYVCRKLRLAPGERLLDIGCGWGALVIHAARHYGARATGITLSQAQAGFARERVTREGVGDRVTIDIRDYRSLDRGHCFDKIASVGMVEHVGLARLPQYFAAAYRALKPGGLFLNHGIVSLADARRRPLLDPVWRRLWRRDQFIRRYVFPDGDLVPAAAVLASAEAEGFELRDVESLREHYVETLRRWVRRLEAGAVEARRIVGDTTYRVWRLYMAASAHGFRVGRIGVIQSLLAKPDRNGDVRLPRNRADLYSRPVGGGEHD